MTRVRLARGVLALLCAGAAGGCGSQAAPVRAQALRVQTAPLSTSLVTPQGTWAVAVMGGSAADENNFWQLFVRPADGGRGWPRDRTWPRRPRDASAGWRR